ncbi:MAG TPA: hypothetical protein VIL92_06245 [Gaiellaceae bacterium]
MHAHVEHNWQGRTVDAWLWLDETHYLQFGEATIVTIDRHAEQAEPSLRINERAFEALMREAEGVVPAGTGTTEALRDTRVVRDRLLTLVEQLTVKA